MEKFWKKSHSNAALVLFFTLSMLAVAPAVAANYEINVILPQTGSGSFMGRAEQHALELLRQSVNASGGIQGRPVQFNYLDDQSSPQTAVQLANQVLATHPAVMIGSALVALCNAMAPLMQNGPVMYCMSPGIHPAKGSYVFTASVSTHDLENALIRYFRMKGWTRIALITSTDASGQDAERGIDEVMKLPENKSMVLVERAHFNPTDVSVSAQIERVKAANPQAFIAWSTGAPIATIFKGIIQAGLNVPVATTNGNMTYAQMKQYAAFLPRELYFPVAVGAVQSPTALSASVLKLTPETSKAQDEFYAAYKLENGTPDQPASTAWSPAVVLIDALRKLGPNASATQVRDYLLNLKNYAGVHGIYDFEKTPQRGLNVDNAVVTRWDVARQGWETMSQPTGIPLGK